MIDTDQIASIPDPKERALAARAAQTALQAAHDDRMSELGIITAAAIREMRDGGLSLARIGVILDVTSGRVQQLEQRGNRVASRRIATAERLTAKGVTN